MKNISVFILIILITLSFLYSPGTGDMDIWMKWSHNIDNYGIAEGYKINMTDYPPYSSVILFCAVQFCHLFKMEMFTAIKLSIVVLLFLTSLIFWFWNFNINMMILLHFSLFLNSVALGYIDIYFAPMLILSMWALREKRLILFTLCFSIACLIKWQPIIILPFIMSYIVKEFMDCKSIDRKNFYSMLSVAIIIVIFTMYIFGLTPVLRAFKASLSHNFLSGNALNFNWILTHLLHVLYPESFGNLVNGLSTYICTNSLKVTLISRILFLLSYVITILMFLKRKKKFEFLILFSLLGFLSYFIFNIGVHENHLFLATILAIILLSENKKYFWLTMNVILMNNINLFLFYGSDGLGLRFNRVIGNFIDIALIISLFNVTFFSVAWGKIMLIKVNVEECNEIGV
ncbi:hypothetical protein U14_02965 [Candidatus Moduliflexus flocculans]|uniref:Uncharacterized protein n=1 Tax=Candidatus Moduliflexus flocculans TaxID=1499966 RepID=A0A081BMV4_9BACT|nr:hypothetical protein U14_02965 [Candidatus Moduliflexus flocculans]